MGFKKLTWLKCGVLLTLVDILFWLIFIIWAFQGEGSPGAMLNLDGCWIPNEKKFSLKKITLTEMKK